MDIVIRLFYYISDIKHNTWQLIVRSLLNYAKQLPFHLVNLKSVQLELLPFGSKNCYTIELYTFLVVDCFPNWIVSHSIRRSQAFPPLTIVCSI